MKEPKTKPSKRAPGLSEAQLDETLEETFPASDPPSFTPTSVGRPQPPRGVNVKGSAGPPGLKRRAGRAR